MTVPKIRIRDTNEAPVRPDGEFVLYWMTAFRRLSWNFSLDRAIEWARELGKPLVVLEALRIGYPWSSDRLHAFMLQGMRDNLARAQAAPVAYYPYLERKSGAGKGLLASLAKSAAVIVTDDFPAFFLPRMLSTAAGRLAVRLESVDSNGLLPLRATDRIFARAVDFRRFLQRELPQHLDQVPGPDPLRCGDLRLLNGSVLRKIENRWPALVKEELEDPARLVSGLDIDHTVSITDTVGGSAEAEVCWRSFLEGGLERYAAERNHPDTDSSSRLSPYLHFGHLSSHQVFAEIAERESWPPLSIGATARGQRQGWWGMSEAAESYLDQIVTWRELGYNMTSKSDRYSRFESLPDWARCTIDDHRDDPRPWSYDIADFEGALTHDELWNAAQRQLVREGRIHNYLRMLWGKKIYEWSEHPEEALEVMIDLNNKYALDGRDPSSYSGIFWCLGRYDRAWGPERPIFGKLRYMTSESTRRKLRSKRYLELYGSDRP